METDGNGWKRWKGNTTRNTRKGSRDKRKREREREREEARRGETRRNETQTRDERDETLTWSSMPWEKSSPWY
jgi:hypothetical protein